KHDAWLMIDDANGFGVLGDNGWGTLEHGRVSTAAVPVYMATLGKALGTAGAFIAGSDELVETLIQKARTTSILPLPRQPSPRQRVPA
ncbi:MAG: aminotransferase class I/II-fold pyridoxal phosphate-dependent enzyme, partial [Gammaproteobacteria bacterium]|nr:aminotransferase class I/II-fold pyridoxal phosphate-dependent enzyme [Gammaproteobacteria bacterium]